MARIVVAGAGAIGASIAHELGRRGVRDVVLAERAEVASGATGKAMGGVRQQFMTAPEVRLARESVRFFEKLGAALFEQVGYLFLATTEAGLEALEDRLRIQHELGVPVERVDASFVHGLATDDVLAAVICREDGVADPIGTTRELVRRAADLGVEVCERTDALSVAGDVLVIACGAASPELATARGVELPVRPLVRQLVDTRPVEGVPAHLPMTIEAESGFHFRRIPSGGLRLAMPETAARWGSDAAVDEDLVDDWLERLGRRYPPADGVLVERSWAGLYDMTPDAHPIIGWVAEGVYAACGFSGHGFMQSPAVGVAAAAELAGEESPFDLSPYRLERFAGGATFPETLVL